MSLATTALLPNPDGSPPNFINPPSLEKQTCSISIIVMTASSMLVGGRLYANWKMSKRLALDDYFCIFAWVLTTTYTVIIMTATNTARHIWDVPYSAIDASWIKRSAVLATIYGPAMWFAKTAILTMYLRLFSVKLWMRWSCYFAIAFLFIAYWSLVPVSVIYNFPHGDEEWDLAMSVGSEPSQLPFVIMGLISVVADVFILVLPFPILLNLKVSWKRKLGLALVFLTAIVGIIASCLVFALRVVLWKNETQDMTWNVAASVLTVVVEMNVAVMVSCAPAAAAFWNLTMKETRFLVSLRSAFAISKNALRPNSGAKSRRKTREAVPKVEEAYLSLDSLQMLPK